ncbi:MAG: signal peptidase I [Nitrososphaeraceae archaeon]
MISRSIIYISITIIGIAGIGLGLRVVLGTYNPFYTVASGSMIPALNVNDFVVVSNVIPFSKLKVGDIIVFSSVGSLIPGERHETVVHRIVRITTMSRGDEIIRTKGDANSRSIPLIDYPIRKQNYVGKVIYVFPKLGLITKLTNPPTNYFIMAGVIILIVVYYTKTGKKEGPTQT